MQTLYYALLQEIPNTKNYEQKFNFYNPCFV